jgi:thioredoxin 1
MREPITLTDENLDAVLNTDKPTLILISNGDGLRGDFKVAFNKKADEDAKVVYARLDPLKNPVAAARFSAGEKPLLVGWYCGEEVVRRPRPWGTDLPLALEQLQASVHSQNPQQVEESETQVEEKLVVLDSPVTVTDATFEQEVLNSQIPVLVDFWAPWCGPCRMVAPILDKLAKEFAGQIKVAKVNTDENPGLSQAFRIMSIPNLMVVKQRTIIFNQPGALPEAPLRNLIAQAIALEIPPKTQPAPEQQ